MRNVLGIILAPVGLVAAVAILAVYGVYLALVFGYSFVRTILG